MLIFLEGQRNMMFSGKDVVKEGTFIVPAQVEEEALLLLFKLKTT